MTEKGYKTCVEFFAARPKTSKAAIILQKALEIAVYINYPLFIGMLIFGNGDFWWKSLLVCGIGFVAVTLFRKRLNAQRPYEKFGFTPTLKKEKKGCSFPSRHAFSAAIIAVNIGIIYLPWGIVLGVVAVLIAALRVVLGVHFIKDVFFGLLCGVALGLIALI